MAKRAAFLFVMGVLFVSTALAAKRRQVEYKLDGTLASASCLIGYGAPGVSMYLNIYPFQLPDGGWAYSAQILWNDGSAHEIYGLVPLSVVRSQGPWGPLHVNITNASFYEVEEAPLSDSGGFISLEGTFTAYTGIGSATRVSSGRIRETWTHLDGSKEISSFNGTNAYQSAGFEGTLVTTSNTFDLLAQGPERTASISVQVGNMMEVIITPPTP